MPWCEKCGQPYLTEFGHDCTPVRQLQEPGHATWCAAVLTVFPKLPCNCGLHPTVEGQHG